MAELSEKYVNTSESEIIGVGIIRKQGELFKQWKIRNYKLFSDGILITFDPAKNVSTNIYNLSRTSFGELDSRLVDKSGAPAGGFALSVDCLKLGQLDLVFDSRREAEDFVVQVGKVNLCNAIAAQKFSYKLHWHACVDAMDSEIERLEEEMEESDSDDSDSGSESSVDSTSSQRFSELNAAAGSTTHSVEALHSAVVDTFTDTDNSIVCAGKFLKQNSFKKSCYADDWKERSFVLRKNGELVYVNRIGFDQSLDLTGCIITYVEVEIIDADSSPGAKPDTILAIELLVAKSSKRTKCIAFDAENKENNLKKMDEFVHLLQKTFGAVVMNRSVRGKKMKKEKEATIEQKVEDYRSATLLFMSGAVFCFCLFIIDGYL